LGCCERPLRDNGEAKHGERAEAAAGPDGRVRPAAKARKQGDGGRAGRVRRWRGGRRATVVALDDLSEDDRSALARTPVRRRVEVHVRCSARGCAQAYRAFLSPPSASGDEIAVEDTSGERICGFAGLFAARCPAHRRGQGDRM